jgi:hypothetical protein
VAASPDALRNVRDFRLAKGAARPDIDLAFAGRESANGAFSREIVGRQPIGDSVLMGTL